MNFSAEKNYYSRHYMEFCDEISPCIRTWLTWSNLHLMRDVVFILATHGWQKAVDENCNLEAVDRLFERFSIPLQASSRHWLRWLRCTLSLRPCWHVLPQVHISLRLGVGCSCCKHHTLQIESMLWHQFIFLFSLPASNGKHEGVFSLVNVIKTYKKKSAFQWGTRYLPMVSCTNIPLKDFNLDAAINLWWKERDCVDLTRNKN